MTTLIDPYDVLDHVTISEALVDVNNARLALGLLPLYTMPPGEPVAACDCPISKALSFNDRHALVTRGDVLFVIKPEEETDSDATARLVEAWGQGECPEGANTTPAIMDFIRAFDRTLSFITGYEGE